MWVLVTYDITTMDAKGQKRLRRVAKACERHGRRVQKSVFECKVDDMTMEKLRYQLLKEIDERYDSLRIYRLKEPKEHSVEEYGLSEAIDFDDPLIL